MTRRSSLIAACGFLMGPWAAAVNGQAASSNPGTKPPEAVQGTATLVVVVGGMESDEGAVRVALFDSEASHEEKENPFRAETLPVTERECTWVVTGIPFGSYSVAVYHDRNQNGELDTSFLGIPSEPYAFSNDARSRFGPPSFQDARFEVREDSVTIDIRVR
jgi:uncharacterized protein (DUF2141 family)